MVFFMLVKLWVHIFEKSHPPIALGTSYIKLQLLWICKGWFIYTRFRASIQNEDGFIRLYDCISVMRDVSRASHELRRSESKRRSSVELSKNLSERRGLPSQWVSAANEQATTLFDTLVKSRQACYWCIRKIVY